MPRKKTHEEFVAEVYEKYNDEIIIIGKYNNNFTQIKIKHSICGKEINIKPTYIINKSFSCCHCRSNRRKISFMKNFKIKSNGEYTLESEYLSLNKNIKVKHVKCGNIFTVTANNFLYSGSKCPHCYKTTRREHDDFVKMVEKLDNNYKVLTEYKNSTSKVKMQHIICGNEYEVKPNNFLSGKRCPKCFGAHKKTTEQFKEEVHNLEGDSYSVLGGYTNNNTKILMRHNVCGHEYETTPSSFTSKGTRCPKCAGNIKWNTDKFKKEVYNLVDDEYLVNGKYTNTVTKIKMFHRVCGYEWEIAPRSFINNGTRCPKCNESKGERKVSDWLDKNKVKHRIQYKFEDCKDKSDLPFDFAVFNNKDELILLIEYDGEQHFEPMRYSENKEKMLSKLKQVQRHDNIKNEYCKDNNIPLLRIPYWDYDNVEKILDKELSYLIHQPM